MPSTFKSLFPLAFLSTVLLPTAATAQDDADDILREYGVYDIVEQYLDSDQGDNEYHYTVTHTYYNSDDQPNSGTTTYTQTYTRPAQQNTPSQANQPYRRPPMPAQPKAPSYPPKTPINQPDYQRNQPSTNAPFAPTGDPDIDEMLNEAYRMIDSDPYAPVIQNTNPQTHIENNTKVYNNVYQNDTTAPVKAAPKPVPAPTNPPTVTVAKDAPAPSKVTPTPANTAGNALPASGNATYRAMLSDYEKKLYDPIYQAVTERRQYVTVSGDLDANAMKRVIEAITNDHPEVIWMSESFSHEKTLIGQTVTETKLMFKYNDLVYQPTQAAQSFANASAEIIRNARAAGSGLAMEKYVHDYLASHVNYGSNALDQTAYGAIVNRHAVCAGFARAFKHLMDQLGIPCYVVTGMQATDSGAMESHAWNLVYIDGKWRNVDVTSDLVEITNGRSSAVQIDYRLFNKTDQEFKKMGYVRENEYSSAAFILPSCN
ncbi:MAG: hypothetical protein IKY83_13130 [Proteobacteria bacterium]|nr:hypothetical protein [Pseudomonadota bacterium]